MAWHYCLHEEGGGARGQMWTKYTDSHGLKAMMHIWSWHQQLIKSTSYFWMAKLWMLACIIALFHTVTNRKNTWKLHCNRSRKPLWHVSEMSISVQRSVHRREPTNRLMNLLWITYASNLQNIINLLWRSFTINNLLSS